MKKQLLIKIVVLLLVFSFPAVVLAKTNSVYELEVEMLQITDQILQRGEGGGKLTSADIAELKEIPGIHLKEYTQILKSGDKTKLVFSKQQFLEIMNLTEGIIQKIPAVQSSFADCVLYTLIFVVAIIPLIISFLISIVLAITIIGFPIAYAFWEFFGEILTEYYYSCSF